MTTPSPGSAPHSGQVPSAPPQVWVPQAWVPQQEIGLRVLRTALAAVWVATVLAGDALGHTPAAVPVVLHWSDAAELAVLVLLIGGPQPRFATKWAWFWLLGAGWPVVAFLLLEPVPAWQAAPAAARQSRLTGGWAFLIAVLLGVGGSAVTSWLPWLGGQVAGLLGVWQG